MISLNLQDFPGVWLQPWRHRSLSSSLHRAFCSAPDPSCTTCHPESQLVSVLSSEQEGVTGFLPGCRGPMAGWESHGQTLQPGELCYDHFILGAGMDGPGTVPIFILDSPLSLHNTFFSGQKWLKPVPPSFLFLPARDALYWTLWFSPRSSPNFSLSGSEQEGSFLRDLGNMFDYFRDWAVIMRSSQMFSPRLLLMLPTMISTSSHSCVLCTFNDFKAITEVNVSCLISPVCNKHVSIKCIGVFQKSNNQIEKGFCYIPFIVWTHSQD